MYIQLELSFLSAFSSFSTTWWTSCCAVKSEVESAEAIENETSNGAAAKMAEILIRAPLEMRPFEVDVRNAAGVVSARQQRTPCAGHVHANRNAKNFGFPSSWRSWRN